MAGISHVLGVAKEALLTHQLSVQVAANNIANVDTPGYTRQTLALKTQLSTPVAAGMLGGGVSADSIIRNYDQFMTQRIVGQQTLLGNLGAQQEAMRMVETVFNEAPGMAINDLMNKFWSSWQDLADNPELTATRQTVVQNAQLVMDQLHSMSMEMAQAKFDIGVSLDTAIGDVNSIVSQIANINVQIAGAESSKGQANDLRDQRDNLLQQLGGLVEVSYFDDKNGGITVLLADGHTLVAGNESWQVDWENNELIWVNRDSNGLETRKSLGDGAELGGKIGGWLEVRSNLTEGNPENFLGRLDAFANALIREVNQVHSQGVGLVLFGDTITGTEQAKNVTRLTTPLDAATANVTIPSGTMSINDRKIGEILGGTAVNGLAMSKAYNAVKAINTAEAGVEARLTTQVAGAAVTPMGASPANDGETLSFTVNGASISYTIDNDGAGADDSSAATFAARLAAEINTDIATHNALAATTNPVTIEAVVGDGTNGGAINSIVLRNTNAGDSSNIVIANLSTPVGLESVTGLTAGTYQADASHNTGELTLFSTSTIKVVAGSNDLTLAQLGMGGGNATTTFYNGGTVNAAAADTIFSFKLNGAAVNVNVTNGDSAATVVGAIQTAITAVGEPVTVSLVNGKIRFQNSTSGDNSPIVVDSFTSDGQSFGISNFTAKVGGVAGDADANDGRFTFTADNGGAGALLSGYSYFDELDTDQGSLDIWIYKDDGSLAMPQPISVSLERAYSLDDAVAIINKTIENATNNSGWLNASISQGSLRLTPQEGYRIAFANDSTKLLQVAGVNTFFSGKDAASIGINGMVENDLNNLAAAKVGSLGQIFRGDNTNALKITEVGHDEYVQFTGGGQNNLDGFYNSLVGQVANSTRTINRSYEFNTLVANQMGEMRDGISGVSLDEEMANLVKFQHAYTAAARLITMSDEMLQTVLDSVR